MAIKKQEIDWKKVKQGTWFSALIHGTKCIGRIQKEDGDIYLCQNEKQGSPARNKRGFKYSWIIGKGNLLDIETTYVTNLKLLAEKPKTFEFKPVKQPTIVGGYELRIEKGYIMVGCTKVTNAEVRRICSKLKN